MLTSISWEHSGHAVGLGARVDSRLSPTERQLALPRLVARLSTFPPLGSFPAVAIGRLESPWPSFWWNVAFMRSVLPLRDRAWLPAPSLAPTVNQPIVR